LTPAGVYTAMTWQGSFTQTTNNIALDPTTDSTHLKYTINTSAKVMTVTYTPPGPKSTAIFFK